MQIAFSFFVLGAENAIRRGELSHDQAASAKIANEAAENGVGHARHRGENCGGGDGHSAEANGLGDGHVFSTGGDARAYIARIVPEFPHKPILRKRARQSPRSMRGLKILIDPPKSKARIYFFAVSALAYFLRNLSTRPAVSTSFCLPVKNGWQFEQISTWMSPLCVERVVKLLPQAHMTRISL